MPKTHRVIVNGEQFTAAAWRGAARCRAQERRSYSARLPVRSLRDVQRAHRPRRTLWQRRVCDDEGLSKPDRFRRGDCDRGRAGDRDGQRTRDRGAARGAGRRRRIDRAQAPDRISCRDNISRSSSRVLARAATVRRSRWIGAATDAASICMCGGVAEAVCRRPLGAGIKQGHRVKLTGPFGSAYLRPGLDQAAWCWSEAERGLPRSGRSRMRPCAKIPGERCSWWSGRGRSNRST